MISFAIVHPLDTLRTRIQSENLKAVPRSSASPLTRGFLVSILGLVLKAVYDSGRMRLPVTTSTFRLRCQPLPATSHPPSSKFQGRF